LIHNIKFDYIFYKLIVFWLIGNGNKKISIKQKLLKTFSIDKKLIIFRRNNFTAISTDRQFIEQFVFVKFIYGVFTIYLKDKI
jgi:hypothetical protein